MNSTSLVRRRWWRRAAVMAAAGALAAGSMLNPASAKTYTHASGATVDAPETAVIGSSFTITGTNWKNIAGDAGSVIAVKFDAGAYQHKPGQEIKHPQTGTVLAADIWDVFVADADGTFTRTITLPTAANSVGAAPKAVGGSYTVNLLSGSLGVQDQGRGVPLTLGVVAASTPDPDPTTTTPTPDPTTTTPDPDPTTTTPDPDPTTTAPDPDPTTPAEPSSKADIDVSVDIPVTGGLAVNVASNKLDLGQAKLSSDLSSLDASGTLPAVTVADTRNSNPGWSLTATASNFSASEGLTLDGKYLGIGKTRVVSASAGQTLSLGAGVAPGVGFTGGTTLASAAAGAGQGSATFEADLQLKAPAATTPGDYVSVVTITVS